MELKFPKIEIEKSSDFQTKKFSIGDEQVIINILRSKMYSDPIYIICQEIMSNSRDAHREIGTPDTPIEVTLPTRFDETIKFKDFGIGITPDRMANIFVCYGNSTKRSNNVQTGGFGLGGKTPFSYTDSFNIVTITQHGDKRIKCEYIAYIDETQLGAMSLLKTTDTEAHTGTTICIPVKKDDIKRFEDDVLRVSRFWKVRPNIKNGNKTWEEDEIEFQGTNWYMAKYQGYQSGFGYSRYSGRNSGKAIIIIDGIQYPLKVDTIKGKLKDVGVQLVNRDIRFYFETGEIKVTANREDLDYQPEVIDSIVKRIEKAIEELRTECDKSVVGATSLRAAISAWTSAESSYKHLMVRPKWGGMELVDSYSCPYNSTGDIEVYIYEKDDDGADGTIKFKAHRKSRYGRRSISVRHNWLLFEHDDDGERPHIRKIRTLFADNPSAEYVAGIKFITKVGRAQVEAAFNFSKLDVIKLSDTIKAKIIRSKGSGRDSIIPIKKLISRISDRIGTVWEWKPTNISVTDTAKFVYVTLYSGEQYIDSDKKTKIDKAVLAALSKTLDIPVHGVLSIAARKLEAQWTSLDKHCEKVISELEADADVMNFLKRGQKYTLKNYAHDMWKLLLANQDDLVDKTGVLWRYIEESKKSSAGQDKVDKLHQVQSYLKKDKTVVKSATMKKLQKEFQIQYPLADAVTNGYSRKVNMELVVKQMVSYANMKDGIV